MSYLDWKVGDKLVCVRAQCASEIREGAIYTIRSIDGQHNPPGIYLDEVEVVGPYPGFCASRFRPVQKRTTDISIFTAMLNPSKVDA